MTLAPRGSVPGLEVLSQDEQEHDSFAASRAAGGDLKNASGLYTSVEREMGPDQCMSGCVCGVRIKGGGFRNHTNNSNRSVCFPTQQQATSAVILFGGCALGFITGLLFSFLRAFAVAGIALHTHTHSVSLSLSPSLFPQVATSRRCSTERLRLGEPKECLCRFSCAATRRRCYLRRPPLPPGRYLQNHLVSTLFPPICTCPLGPRRFSSYISSISISPSCRTLPGQSVLLLLSSSNKFRGQCQLAPLSAAHDPITHKVG